MTRTGNQQHRARLSVTVLSNPVRKEACPGTVGVLSALDGDELRESEDPAAPYKTTRSESLLSELE